MLSMLVISFNARQTFSERWVNFSFFLEIDSFTTAVATSFFAHSFPFSSNVTDWSNCKLERIGSLYILDYL